MVLTNSTKHIKLSTTNLQVRIGRKHITKKKKIVANLGALSPVEESM